MRQDPAGRSSAPSEQIRLIAAAVGQAGAPHVTQRKYVKKDITERAYEMARSGEFDSIASLRKALRQEGYDAHLAKLRATLAAQQTELLASLQKHFPNGYRVTRPEGGYFVWVELPRGVDTLRHFGRFKASLNRRCHSGLRSAVTSRRTPARAC